MTPDIFSGCRRYLEMVREMQRGFNKRPGALFVSIEELLLVHGRQFTPAPRPKHIPRLRMKMCYKNAFTLAVQGHGAYCEGYAISEACPIPVLHAWLATPDGTVMDPTWDDGIDYFGVPIRPDFHYKTMRMTGLYAVLDLFEWNYPALRTPPEKWIDNHLTTSNK